jgi:hypothetical protein
MMPKQARKITPAAKKAAAKKAGAKGRTSTGIDSSVVGTHVPKGANRPSAARGKARHAQRTPLPPKGSKPTKTRTQSLKDAAAAQATAAARAAGIDKANDFADYAREHGWWADVKEDKKSSTITVTCKRDDGKYKEVITVEWNGDRVSRGGVLLTIIDGRTILLRNVSAARKHIDGSKVLKREVQERKVRRQRKAVRNIVVNDDGSVSIDDEEDDLPKPVGGHIIDKRYHFTAFKPGKRTKAGKRLTADKVMVRCGPIGSQQVESLTRFFAIDGYEAKTEEAK